MANNIVFLGTGGDSYVVGRQIRASGGIIIQIGDLQFHLDPGPGAVVRAIENNINLRANTALIVTNSSLLHCNDVNAVIDSMTYGGADKNGVLVSNNTIINGEGEEAPYLTKFHKDCIERFIVLNSGQKMAIESVEIHALYAISTDPNAIGLKFLAPDFTLVYTSDTKYSKDIVKEYEGADIIIFNAPLPGEEKSEGQLNSKAVTKIINKIKPKLAILNHFGIKMIKADPLYEGREIQKETGVQVLIAKEGMTISPGSYAAKSNQARLNTFKQENHSKVEIEVPEGPVEERVEEVPEESFKEPEEHFEEETTDDKKDDHQEFLEF